LSLHELDISNQIVRRTYRMYLLTSTPSHHDTWQDQLLRRVLLISMSLTSLTGQPSQFPACPAPPSSAPSNHGRIILRDEKQHVYHRNGTNHGTTNEYDTKIIVKTMLVLHDTLSSWYNCIHESLLQRKTHHKPYAKARIECRCHFARQTLHARLQQHVRTTMNERRVVMRVCV
jgi:hypothetical protein